MAIQTKKDKLRQDIVSLKKKYSADSLQSMSDEVFSVLEITGAFQDAKNIFIYNSMGDEVSTHAFIKRWQHEKKFYLPVVSENDLVFRAYDDKLEYTVSKLGVVEPLGDNFTDYKKVDLVIVPGVAFDRKMNRLGRGKGFYDRFLPKLTKATKLGVCFDFQLLDNIPADKNDIKMDILVSENELIW